MENLDLMIGSHALGTEFALVTNDQAFKRIPRLKVVDCAALKH